MEVVPQARVRAEPERCSGQNRVAVNGGGDGCIPIKGNGQLQWSKSCSGQWRRDRGAADHLGRLVAVVKIV